MQYTEMSHCPSDIPVKRIDADHYVYTCGPLAGTVFDYVKADTKVDCVVSVKRSLNSLRWIINSNCTDSSRLLWVTLTYAVQMEDYVRLYSDFKRFNVRFRRYLKKVYGLSCEYICVAEPQASGRWHMHLIPLFDRPAPFIPNDEIFSLWGQGFTKTKAVHGVDNLGAYFSAYLADLPVEDADASGCSYDSSNVIEKVVVDGDDDSKKLPKKFIKGGRLHYYPAGMNLYRCSRGIKRPLVEDLSDLSWADLQKEKAGLGDPTFSRSCLVSFGGKSASVSSDPYHSDTVITTEYYNTLRS